MRMATFLSSDPVYTTCNGVPTTNSHRTVGSRNTLKLLLRMMCSPFTSTSLARMAPPTLTGPVRRAKTSATTGRSTLAGSSEDPQMQKAGFSNRRLAAIRARDSASRSRFARQDTRERVTNCSTAAAIALEPIAASVTSLRSATGVEGVTPTPVGFSSPNELAAAVAPQHHTQPGQAGAEQEQRAGFRDGREVQV